MELPTRQDVNDAVDGNLGEANSLQRTQALIADQYAQGVLMTRQEFIDSLKDEPTLDMGDDNHWVMVDLGPLGGDDS